MIIRVDADQHIGMGHLTRCLAIADCMSARGISVTFAISSPDEAAERLVRARGHDLRPIRASRGNADDAVETIELAHPGEVILIDGYRFSDDFESQLADSGLRVTAIDDYGHASHADARIIINSNLYYARKSRYSRAPGAKLLLGPRFLPFRKEFTHLRTLKRANLEVASLLVSFGGGDVRGALPHTLDVLRLIVPSQVKIYVATGCVGRSVERNFGGLDQKSGIDWVEDFTRLPEVMTTVDMAIAAGGMTSYELAFMGVPSLLLPATPIQAPVARELARLGAAIDLGLAGEFPARALNDAVQDLLRSRENRQSMIDKGQSLFDGLGARRCSDALVQLSGAGGVRRPRL